MPNSTSSALKIADWEYLQAEQMVDVYLEHLQTACTKFSEILNKVEGYALEDGEHGIVANLKAKALLVDGLAGKVEEIKSSIDGQAKAFIEKIDELDNFVYGED